MSSDSTENAKRRRQTGKWLRLAWAGLILAGCSGAKSGNYLENISAGKPEIATSAMNEAAQKKSPEAIVPLIKRLHDEDPAIRLSAITALKSITGQDFGYRSYEPPTKRALAIQRWWDWAQQENIASSLKTQPMEHAQPEPAEPKVESIP